MASSNRREGNRFLARGSSFPEEIWDMIAGQGGKEYFRNLLKLAKAVSKAKQNAHAAGEAEKVMAANLVLRQIENEIKLIRDLSEGKRDLLKVDFDKEMPVHALVCDAARKKRQDFDDEKVRRPLGEKQGDRNDLQCATFADSLLAKYFRSALETPGVIEEALRRFETHVKELLIKLLNTFPEDKGIHNNMHEWSDEDNIQVTRLLQWFNYWLDTGDGTIDDEWELREVQPREKLTDILNYFARQLIMAKVITDMPDFMQPEKQRDFLRQLKQNKDLNRVLDQFWTGKAITYSDFVNYGNPLFNDLLKNKIGDRRFVADYGTNDINKYENPFFKNFGQFLENHIRPGVDED